MNEKQKRAKGGRYYNIDVNTLDTHIYSYQAIECIKAFINHLYLSKKLTPSTIYDYLLTFKRFEEWLHTKRPDLIPFSWNNYNEGVSRAFRCWYAQKAIHGGTVFSHLRRLYQFGIAKRIEGFDPEIYQTLMNMKVQYRAKPHEYSKDEAFWPDEVDLINKVLQENKGNIRDRIVILIHLNLGLNPNSTVQLQNRDLQLTDDGYWLNVPEAKQRYPERTTIPAPITNQLGQLLEQIRKGRDTDKLLYWLPKNHPEASIRNAMKRWIKVTKIVSPHTGELLEIYPRRFRDYVATCGASRGLSNNNIVSLISRTSPDIAMNYVNVTPWIVPIVTQATDWAVKPLIERFLGTTSSSLVNVDYQKLSPIPAQPTSTRKQLEQGENILPLIDNRYESTEVAIKHFVDVAKSQFVEQFPQQSFGDKVLDISKLKYLRLDRSSHLHFTRHGSLTQPLPQDWIHIIKAWIVLNRNSVSFMQAKLAAARVLYESIIINRPSFTWDSLCEHDFHRAEIWMRERQFSNGTIHLYASRWRDLINCLTKRGICWSIDYTPPPDPRKYQQNTLAGQQVAMNKMPSRHTLEGLADIYAYRSDSPQDILRICGVAILIATGLRISELLTLPYNCIKEREWNGEVYYGVQYYQTKTSKRGFYIRWLTPIQARLVIDAVNKIKELTSEAREQAKILEQNPNRIPLPNCLPHDKLYVNDVNELLGYKDNGKTFYDLKLPRHKDEKGVFCFAKDLEAYLLKRRKKLWTIQFINGVQKLSESLFIIPRNFFSSDKPINELLVQPMIPVQFNSFLKSTKDGQPSIFEQLGYKEEDGSYCATNPHAFRHWLNTVAHMGGMPIDHQDYWLGRINKHYIRSYIHLTPEQWLDWMEGKVPTQEEEENDGQI